ncbi:hypothetical protein A3J15_00995 [Candidatus Roizmanbacteria bacterium RIFCSPLOWO2_02_FULL_38_10]|uniref:VTT domain-containing protein n=1 Tax=Candidatus Roizmanbacteria bacterium RIFCSPLOWO2_02_FULL_38_10 TaxID=1802074 RepID=A0A1F7JJI9_9BACT|nr:MAG: hypothetical protein A3J15_00995 [Candidatus Roizmanbacteria bacterium RIFCSPLOWO2_02_FULL_38_10]
MLEGIIAFLSTLIIDLISRTGYFGIFFLMTIESALIPMPSEVTMPFSGYLASTGKFNFWWVVIIGTIANLVGSVIIYLIGHWGEDTFAHQCIRKYGKYILISEHELQKSEKWFRDHGDKIVFFSRVLPVVRTYISLPAGAAHMNFKRFCILTTLGSFIWSIFLTYIGFVLGKNWNSLHPYYQKFEYIIVGGFFILGIYWLWHKYKKVFKK